MSQTQIQTPGHRPNCGCRTCRPAITVTVAVPPTGAFLVNLQRALLVKMRPAECACQTCGEWLEFDGSCRHCAPSAMPCRLCGFWKRKSAEGGVCWADHENGTGKHPHQTCEAFARRCAFVTPRAALAPDLARGFDFGVGQ